MLESTTKIVKKIFLINIFAYILVYTALAPLLILHPFSSDEFNIIQLISHQFLHNGLIHIIFNMIAFLTIGPDVERYLGERSFILVYLICGVGAAFLQEYINPCTMVGASGSIYGIFAIYSLINPERELFIMFIPIPIKAKNLFIILFLIEVFSGFTASDHTAHFAHVGGAITGYLMLKLLSYNGKYKV